MKGNAARLIDWSKDALRHYYGLSANAARRCPFRQMKDFTPDCSVTLGDSAPRQLHNTERHESGAGYIHLSKGAPDLKGNVIQMLDGHSLPYELMRAADEHLSKIDIEAWSAAERLRWRSEGVTLKAIAEDMGIGLRTLYDRRDRAVDRLAGFLDRELERIVNGA